MVYFPIVSKNLTIRDIKALDRLSKDDFVRVALLTDETIGGGTEALEDREFILQVIVKGLEDGEDVKIVHQTSLDVAQNIRKYHCTALALFKWEKEHIEIATRYGLKKIDLNIS